MNVPENPAWPQLSLAVAGLGVTLSCNDDRLVEKLSRRYRDFPMEGQTQLVARVQAKRPEPGAEIPDPAAVFDGDVLRFGSPDYSGSVDRQRKSAELFLATPNLLEGVDYFLRVIYSLLAFDAGGLLVHAAGIVRGGRAYLFFGHSGSGKTTVARLSPGDLVLNDDLVLLLPAEFGWVAYATPFWNPTQVPPTRHSAQLAGLYRLAQDKQVFLEELAAGSALAELLSSVPVIPQDPRQADRLLERGKELLAAVPVYRLHFLPEASFWDLVVK